MNYEDLNNEEKSIWDTGYAAGHDAGYEDGWNEYAEQFSNDDWNDAFEQGEFEGFKSGFEKGVLAEQQRIQDVLGMMFESSLNMGQGNKAVQYRHAMDLLRPININYEDNDD